ncbi:beta-lactamase family protein [Gammaproteobacteria bacterium]|nr:beta-lactamase family protein [Gammaproteobacteria bacterium]
MNILRSFVIFFAVVPVAFSSSLDATDQENISKHFNAYVNEGKIPHISILAHKDGKEIYRHAHGHADIESKTKINKDSIFRIYSMSKPVTGVAIMQLVEQGKLRLADKVSLYIPGFKNTKVLNLEYQDYMVKPKREMTIRDLLTHTSGLTYSWAGEGPVQQMYRKYNIRPYFFGALDSEMSKFPGDTCAFAATAASVPLLHNPGEKWSYGINMDILGCVVEVVSGLNFAQYLQENIFDPLKLNSMGFDVKPKDNNSFTTLYTSGLFSRDGEIIGAAGVNPADLMFSKELRQIDPYLKSPYQLNTSKLYDGGSGLVSNIDDYAQFALMLMNKGELNGVRILSESSVEMMSKNHLSDSVLSDGAAFGLDGVGFGLTMAVVEDAGRAGTYSTNGEFSWGGAASTTFWVDPVNQVTAVMMTQYMPSDKYPLREDLKTLIYSGLSNE